MILVPRYAILPKALAHKGCGGYVEGKPFLPGFYVCPKCETLLHANNVELRDPPVVA